MTQATAPFAISGPLPTRLDAVFRYWQGLLRGSAEVPFWDDVSMPAVEALCDQVFLVEVFARPERFRLSAADAPLTPAERDAVLGRFIDDVALPDAFALLRAQSSAAVECMRPTLYIHEPKSAEGRRYQRLLLPLWGEGEVRMLLGAVD